MANGYQEFINSLTGVCKEFGYIWVLNSDLDASGAPIGGTLKFIRQDSKEGKAAIAKFQKIKNRKPDPPTDLPF